MFLKKKIIFLTIILFSQDFTFLNAAFFENTSSLNYIESFFFKKQKYFIFLIFFLPSIYLFKKKKFITTFFFVIIQLFIILYWSNLIIWIRDLAGDSLSEVKTLNFLYIHAWFSSLFNYLKPKIEIVSFFKFYLISFLFYLLLAKFIKNEKKLLVYFPIFLSTIFIYLFINFNISHLIGNIKTQKEIKKNFFKSKNKFIVESNTNIILFIGESNSQLNSDYFIKNIINKKSNLEKGEFNYFRNIYSTHTHSTPTLLRLFSLQKSNNDNDLLKPIIDQKRTDIFSFLSDNINKTYISSTGIDGYNNLHYSVFFKDFNQKYFLNKSEYFFEKEFFKDKIKKTFKDSHKNHLIVLHSSVGHAPYHKFIPDDIKLNNNILLEKNSIKLLGEKKNFLEDILNYEKALKYNFENLEDVINLIDENSPTVLIYLSDHGESVYTGNGHDSSRLSNEMLRVPFVIFYNNKFLRENRNVFISHQKFINKINTTDIFKEIFFDIYPIKEVILNYKLKIKNTYDKIIFQRNKNKFIELIDLNFDKIELPSNFILKNDKDTNIHILSNHINNQKICYHASNTVARIKRGLSLSSCLEFDLTIDNQKFYIFHPPRKNINFSLDEFLSVSTNAKSLWIDAKNIDNSENCNLLLNKIKKLNISDKMKILIEFPTTTNYKNEKIVSCIKNFKLFKVEVSYYISNKKINECLKEINYKNKSCEELKKEVINLDKIKLFDNISFDFKFAKIIEILNIKFDNLNLNTWHINYEQVKNIKNKKYNFIIPYNSDLNRNNF